MRILVIGGNGLLGTEVVAVAERTGHEVIAPRKSELDITSAESLAAIAAGDYGKLDTVVNCAAFTAVDRAETDIDAATDLNTLGPGYLSAVCALAGVRLAHVSTDFVFDGSATEPYLESTPTSPLGIYGRTKRDGEEAVRDGGAESWIFRTSWLYGVHGMCFPAAILRAWQSGKPLRVVSDQFGSPTYARELARMILEGIQKGIPPGIYHATGGEALSWHGFAEILMRLAEEHTGRPTPSVEPIASVDWPTTARRPAYSVLSNAKLQATGVDLHESLEASLALYLREALP